MAKRLPKTEALAPGMAWTDGTNASSSVGWRLMYVDTSVFMYACGSPSPFKQPCAELLSAGAAGRLSLVTSVETLHEILCRYRSIRRTDDLSAVFEAVLAGTRSVLPIEIEDLHEARALGDRIPTDSGVCGSDSLTARRAAIRGILPI